MILGDSTVPPIAGSNDGIVGCRDSCVNSTDLSLTGNVKMGGCVPGRLSPLSTWVDCCDGCGSDGSLLYPQMPLAAIPWEQPGL